MSYPATPDSLILSYVDAYNARQSSAIDSLLAPGFEFWFAQFEIDAFDIPASWSKEAEMISTKHLFEGASGVWPDGSEHPPAGTWEFDSRLTPLGESEWSQNELTKTWSRSFEVFLRVQVAGREHLVGGSAVIEVLDMSTDGAPGGEAAVGFTILSWTDLGLEEPLREDDLSRHLSSWGFIRAVFR